MYSFFYAIPPFHEVHGFRGLTDPPILPCYATKSVPLEQRCIADALLLQGSPYIFHILDYTTIQQQYFINNVVRYHLAKLWPNIVFPYDFCFVLVKRL